MNTAKVTEQSQPPGENVQKTSKLVGCWHAMASVGSGYADRYCFSDDGNFSFFPSQYDENRTAYVYHGSWELGKGTLTLTYTKSLYLDKTETQVSRQIALTTGEIEKDTSGSPYSKKMKIGGDYYWQYSEEDDFWNHEVEDFMNNE